MTEKELNDVLQYLWEHELLDQTKILTTPCKDSFIYQSDFGPICLPNKYKEIVTVYG